MSKRPDQRTKPTANPKSKPTAKANPQVADRPKKAKPSAASASKPLSKKAAARAAGDAARAAGVIDDFARNRTPAAKPATSKTTAKPAGKAAATPSVARTAESSSTRPATKSAKPGRPGRSIAPTYEADIVRLDDEGLGIGRHENKELLIAGAYPGERVAFTIEAEGQRRVFGRLRKVLSARSERIVPVCRCAGNCQGCPLIALDYPAQLRAKQARVAEALGRYPALRGVPVHAVWGASHPFGYRTNAKLIIAKHRGVVSIGLYRRGSHAVVDIGDCPLHHPLINRIVAVVKEEITRQDIHVYDPFKQRGLLRYLAIKVAPAQNKAMVTFVTAERDYRQVTHLAKWLEKKVPEVISVQQNSNPSSGNVIFGRETVRLLGAPDLLDQIGDVRLRISPTAFFQVNNEQAARIYRLVQEWAAPGPEETAVDLYCGIGGIALHLAQSAGAVIGIELSEEAVKNARENARLNGVSNCRFSAGDADELAEDLPDLVPLGAVVAVNPPRGGCAPDLLKALAAQRPRMLLYVSCNPETLARDLDLLAGHGYRTREVQPVDMFPQTGHIESVACLLPAPATVPAARPAPPKRPASTRPASAGGKERRR